MSDDSVIVEHCRALWESYGTPPEHILPDADDRVRSFIDEGRKSRRLAAFIAEDDGKPVASSGCQIYISPYPEVIAPQYRLYGYVWAVFVETEYRRRGVARQLMERMVEYLKREGCTHIALHSSEAARRLYGGMGFASGTEMRLSLAPQSSP